MSEQFEIHGKSHIILNEGFSKTAKIKVIGVGGAGGNALNHMKELDIGDVEFIAVNTDSLALQNSLADEKIAIGKETTKNLGAGADPEVGRKAILEDKEILTEKIKNADMVFIAAGMGGGTGTGAAPVVAEIAKELGILTVAVVTMPFRFEGPVRKNTAKTGLATLKQNVDTIIVINNQNVLSIIDKNTTTTEAYKEIDKILGNAVSGVCNIITKHGMINIDFNDIKRILTDGGSALMGTGIAEGENRALLAAEAAITCPLLGQIDIKGAGGILVNVSHGEDFTMFEFDAAMEYLAETVGIDLDGDEGETNFIYGDCMLKELGNAVSITVFATKFRDDYSNVKVPKKNQEFFPEMKQASLNIETPTITRTEASIGRKTTRFADLANKETPKVTEQTPVYSQETIFSSFNDNNLDVRTVNAQEEVFGNTASEKLQINGNNYNTQALNTQTLAQVEPPVLTDEKASVCPADLDLTRLPTNNLYDDDTKKMEAFRSQLMSNDF